MRRKTHRWAIILEKAGGLQPRGLSQKDGRNPLDAFLVSMQKRLGDAIPMEHYLDPAQLHSLHPAIQAVRPGSVSSLIYSLLHLSSRDCDSVVGLFPAGHSQEHESLFPPAVREAFHLVQSKLCRSGIIVLGRRLESMEDDSGWIEAKRSVLGCSGGVIRQVLRFWSKPPRDVAVELVHRGCLRNTSVMVARTDVLLKVIGQAEPELLQTAEIAWKHENPATVLRVPATAVMAATDLSNHLLSLHPEKLFVLPVEEFRSGSEGGQNQRAAST